MTGAGERPGLETPLTSTERDDLRRRFEARRKAADARMSDVFAFRPLERPFAAVTGAVYFFFGRAPQEIPADYYTDPAVMVASQERAQYEHLLAVDDDYVPYLMPWFGTVVAASAFGCRVSFPPGQDPAVDPTYYPIQSPEDIRRMRRPDPERDGIMPKILEVQRYMKANGTLPVGITDFQGPLTTANQLMGYDKLIYLMYDDPAAMHQLMDTITTGLIDWVTAQKAVIGEDLHYCIGDQQMYLGSNAGVWFSDDDAVLVDADLYGEFVVPYNSRILTAFGGGVVHFCGNGTHHAQNFLATDGLVGLNTFTLHDLDATARLQSLMQDKVVLIVGDHTPLDYRAYFDALRTHLDPRGVAILSLYSPILGLLPDGRYEQTDRAVDGADDVYRELLDAFGSTDATH